MRSVVAVHDTGPKSLPGVREVPLGRPLRNREADQVYDEYVAESTAQATDEADDEATDAA